MAEHAPGAGLQRPQGASRPAQVNEDGGEQSASAVAAAGAVAGLHWHGGSSGMGPRGVAGLCMPMAAMRFSHSSIETRQQACVSITRQ